MLQGLRILLQLLWLAGSRLALPAAEHTRTRRYRAKKKIVRGLWIASGLLMLAYPLLSFIVTLGLFTAFLSFTILDESG